jgi:transcription antitermination factor NusG
MFFDDGVKSGICWSSEQESKPWFGIHVKSQCEVQAFDELVFRGFEAFLPRYEVKRRWSDRVKVLNLPLFPGYLFCRFEFSDRARVLLARGVVRILSVGSKPTPISDSEIRSVQTLVVSKAVLEPWPYLQSGTRVRIAAGPLAGVEGIVIRAENGRSRVVVSVDLLQRAVATEIDRNCIGRLA